MKTVYVSFSSDVIHGGHINIIKKASRLGKVIAGVLTDDVVASYKRVPVLSVEKRMEIISNIKGVEQVVIQDTLSYKKIIEQLKPDYIVHGDDWKNNFLTDIRREAIELLELMGGTVVEFPYTYDESFALLEEVGRSQYYTPDVRRGMLKKLLSTKKLITAIEAHNGITGLIAEKTAVDIDGAIFCFDAMWVSSLCDSTSRGKPDIELVDMSSRLKTIDEIMDVTTKPIIFDGDTGGLNEHFVYNVKTLERVGVSAVIIEDKTGLKKNSLFGADVEQTQEDILTFCEKIKSGKRALKTKDFMIIARIESLILEKGMDDALSRAKAYVDAGADGIMIHSRKKNPDEILEFCEKFRQVNLQTPLVVVPSSYVEITEPELAQAGVNIVIYANHLTRSAFPAMQKAAKLILENRRAKEADEICMSLNEIITLIPEE